MKVNTEVLTDYLNGKCDEKTKREIEIWQNLDPKNKKYLHELKTYWDAKEYTSTQICFDAEKGYQELVTKKSKQKAQYTRRTLRYAALIAAFISTSLIGYFAINLDVSNTIVINTEQDEKVVLLPDGTSISLAKGSTIEYPNKFSENERLVKLKGEAFFKVANNRLKPFIIITNKTKTKVIGTSFRIIENKLSTLINVETGIVEFMEVDNPTNKVRLVKGEIAKFVEKQKVLLKGSLGTDNDLSKISHLEYQNKKLIAICSDLNELFNKNIKLENKLLEQLSLTAKFENQNFDSILETIAFTLDLEIEKHEDYILLK